MVGGSGLAPPRPVKGGEKSPNFLGGGGDVLSEQFIPPIEPLDFSLFSKMLQHFEKSSTVSGITQWHNWNFWKMRIL